MYAEIKSTDKILINRLDENEQILLEEMYKKGTLASSVLGLDKLTDESGDFGGVLLNFYSVDSKDIEIETEIPKSLTLKIGENYNLPIKSNAGDSQVICLGVDNLSTIDLIKNNNGITFNTTNISDNTKLYYTITAEGYNPIVKTIDIVVEPKNVQIVYLYPYDINGNYIEHFEGISYTITDKSGTEYITSFSEQYNAQYVELPIGVYNMTFSIEGYEPFKFENYEITQNDMLSPATKSEDIRFDTPLSYGN